MINHLAHKGTKPQSMPKPNRPKTTTNHQAIEAQNHDQSPSPQRHKTTNSPKTTTNGQAQ